MINPCPIGSSTLRHLRLEVRVSPKTHPDGTGTAKRIALRSRSSTWPNPVCARCEGKIR